MLTPSIKSPYPQNTFRNNLLTNSLLNSPKYVEQYPVLWKRLSFLLEICCTLISKLFLQIVFHFKFLFGRISELCFSLIDHTQFNFYMAHIYL